MKTANRSKVADQPQMAGGDGVDVGAVNGEGEDADAGESAAVERNRAALNAYMARHYEQLTRRLTWHLGCADLARDSLHDAWLHMANKDKDTFAALDNPGAYIYRVACNAATDCLRANRSWQQDGETEFEQMIDGSPGPDSIAEARSDLAAVDRAMQRLPRMHGAILMALRVDEVPRQEVANRYGLSLRGVDTALRKALDCCVRN
jgi:RNA polymerase sigma factor (sigma-70 family)